MKHTKLIFSFFLFFFLYHPHLEACTTAVISGKYTKDGKPMLWKNRDTNYINNILRYFDDGQYAYIGLVNSLDTEGKSIWIGSNDVGFAIMNSASYNLNLDSNAKLTGYEGRLMKEALATCRTLADFEAFLDAMPKPSGLEANFGVIDAEGGAAFYEFNHEGYIKFDANDARVAPFGYIIRTNYSHTGKLGHESSGYIRYNTVNELFYQKAATTGLTAQYIQQDVAKGLDHSLINENLYDRYGNFPPKHPQYAHLRDYVARISTASSVVVEGVEKGGNPDFTTLWSNVGFPMSSIMVPTWVKGGASLPYVVTYNEQMKDAPICAAAIKLKKEKLVNIRWGKWAQYYIDVNALSDNQGTGIHQIIQAKEDDIYKKTYALIKKWEKEGSVNKKDIKNHYDWLDNYIIQAYKQNFDISLN